MIFIISSFVFFILQTLLVVSRPINVFPEFFFFPHLFTRGLLMYRDFFDHHGPLLFLLLAPLSLDKSLFLLKIFFVVVQSMNLALFLLILKKTTTTLGFVLFGLLFALVNFWFSGNSLWYEQVILTCYLTLFLILITKSSPRKILFASFLVLAASLIKPNAAIIIIPVFAITKNMRILWYAITGWIAVGVFFLMNNGFSQLVESIALFNLSFLNFRSKVQEFFIEREFAMVLLTFVFLAVIIALAAKRIRRIIPSLLFFLSSFTFLLNYRSHIYFLPSATFALILLAASFASVKTVVFLHRLSVIIVIFFLIFTTKKVKHFWATSFISTPYLENPKTQRLAKELSSIIHKNKTFYVFGNDVELYYLLDKKPPVYFTLVFPFVTDYFDVETRTIENLKKNSVDYVITPQPESGYHRSFTRLKNYINRSFTLTKNQKNIYKLYRKNKTQTSPPE